MTSTMFEVIDVTPDNSKLMVTGLVPAVVGEWIHAILSKLAPYLPPVPFKIIVVVMIIDEGREKNWI